MDKIGISNVLNWFYEKDKQTVMTRAKFSASLRALIPNIQKGGEETNQHIVKKP